MAAVIEGLYHLQCCMSPQHANMISKVCDAIDLTPQYSMLAIIQLPQAENACMIKNVFDAIA